MVLIVVTSTSACKKTPPAADTDVSRSAASRAPATPVAPSDCKTCALGSHHRSCAPEFITAARDEADKPVEGTFGCGTLSGAAAQTCEALLACIKKHHCSTNGAGTAPGNNPAAGCYCGKVDPTTCLSGAGVNGPCLAEYHAAAVASVGGPSASADDAKFAGFIAPNAFEAKTAFGLADNIVACAIDARCAMCLAP